MLPALALLPPSAALLTHIVPLMPKTHAFPLSLALSLALAACAEGGADPAGPTPGDSVPAAPADTLFRGFGLSPSGFPLDFNKIEAFFAEVGSFPGGAVMQNGPWRDDVVGGSDAGTIPAAHRAVMDRAGSHGYTPIAVFGWRGEAGNFLTMPGDATNDWTSPTARSAFLSMIADFAATYRPPYIFLGNESDFYFEEDPVDYGRWLDVYHDAYAAIKAASPATRVGPVFNFEHLAGVGGLNQWTVPHWGALDQHDFTRVDVVGLTLYPWFGHARAAEIPADYLAPLLSRIAGTPLAITETGWPAENLVGSPLPWEVGEGEQVDYAQRLSSVLSGAQLEFVNWLFLNAMAVSGSSPDSHKIFGSISIRSASGAKRPIYDLWANWAPAS